MNLNSHANEYRNIMNIVQRNTRPRVEDSVEEEEDYTVERLLLTFVDQGDGTMAASIGGWARDTDDEEVLTLE